MVRALLDPTLRLQAHEKILDVIDDHWVSLWLPILFYFIAWFSALVIYSVAHMIPNDWPIVHEIAYFLILGVLTLGHHWFFIFLLRRKIGCWVVTDKRVIIFDFFPYVRHDIHYVEISDIHEVRKATHGLVPTILGYGEVQLITTGIKDVMVLKYVPRPNYFVNLIGSIRNATLSP